jgi:hypothetical protein
MNLFINPDSRFTFDVYIGLENGVFSTSKEEKTGFKKFTIECKMPSYKDTTEILKSSFNKDAQGNSVVNPVSLSYNFMYNLIKRWNLNDGNELKEVFKEDIENLSPSLATQISLILNQELTDKGINF